MLHLIKETKIDFVGKMKLWLFISWGIILIGIITMFVRGGINYGIDFSGGSLVQLRFKEKPNIENIRKALKTINLGDSEIQQFGEENDLLIRSNLSSDKLEDFGNRVVRTLEKELNQKEIVIQRIEVVGPKAGKDLRQKALLAIYYSLLFMAIYISGRFESKWFASGVIAIVLFSLLQFWLSFFPNTIVVLIFFALGLTFYLWWFMNLKYAFGAVLALVHDVLITLAFFFITNREISLTVVAAFLTIVGFSVNDTIVTFDRMRENFKKIGNQKTFSEIVNISINQTLSRTILTSLTVFFVVMIIFFFGGEVIHDFAFAMIVGTITGVYSSIFIAAPILIYWPERKVKK